MRRLGGHAPAFGFLFDKHLNAADDGVEFGPLRLLTLEQRAAVVAEALIGIRAVGFLVNRSQALSDVGQGQCWPR